VKDALGSVESVLVLGGRSEIALGTVRALAERRPPRVVLAVRDPRGEEDVEPFRAAGAASIDVVAFDADDLESHDELVSRVFSAHGDIDVVLLAFGVLGTQERAESDGEAARAVLHTNTLGSASVMVPVVHALRDQGHGALVVLSSVAAERPRRSNFVYGASKAGLDAMAHGFADALTGSGVQVMVVRPGFVKTKMTAGLDPAPLSTTPEAVGSAIAEGLRRGASTVWVPPVLRWVMSALRHLPGPVFRRLNL
jgi:decaprenylphospho-beta-D-erythro-pentofuranosid-2-ulose 2-reductase